MLRTVCFAISVIIALASVSSTPSVAFGDVIVTLEQNGSDVTFTVSGSIDLSGMGFSGSNSQSGEIDTASLFVVGPDSPMQIDLYDASTSSGPGAIGPTTAGPFGLLVGTSSSATDGSGDLFGLDFEGGLSIITLLPNGYVSGDSLSGRSIYTDESLASLGVSTGSYVWNVGVNTVTLNAGVSPSVLLGDANLDGSVDFLDISPFIAVLSGGTFQAEADCDESGAVDFLDISPFIAILSGS